MSGDDVQDTLTLLAGSTLLMVGLTDLHLRYVKPEMQPLLVGAGLVLAGLALRGTLRLVRELSGRAPASVDTHGHRLPLTTWLIALPLIVLSLVAPPSLGSYAAARTETRIAEPRVELPPLPAARDGAVELTLTDYYTRVLYAEETLQGVRLRLTGFVTPVADRWYVTRISLSCCAADGRPVKVLTSGAQAAAPPPADSWVVVEGTFTAPQAPKADEVPLPTLELTSIRPVEKPREPYE